MTSTNTKMDYGNYINEKPTDNLRQPFVHPDDIRVPAEVIQGTDIYFRFVGVVSFTAVFKDAQGDEHSIKIPKDFVKRFKDKIFGDEEWSRDQRKEPIGVNLYFQTTKLTGMFVSVREPYLVTGFTYDNSPEVSQHP